MSTRLNKNGRVAFWIPCVLLMLGGCQEPYVIKTPQDLLACSDILEGDVYIATNFSSLIWPVKDGFVEAALLAAREINNGGGMGLGGKKLGILSCDTSGDRAIGVANVEAIAKDSRVLAMVGAARSAVFMGESPESYGTCLAGASHGLVSIAPGATNSLVGAIADDGYCFRTCAADKYQGEVQVELIRQLGCTKVFYMSNAGDSYSSGLMNDFKTSMDLSNELAESNGEPTIELVTKSFDPECDMASAALFDLKNVEEEAPYDCFASSLFASEMAPIVGLVADDAIFRERIVAGEFRMLLSDSSYDNGFLRRLSGPARLLLSTKPQGISPLFATKPGCTDRTQDFETKYMLAYQKESEAFQNSVYDAVMILGIAISMLEEPDSKDAGTQITNRTMIRDLLNNKNIQTQRDGDGPLHFTQSWVEIQQKVRQQVAERQLGEHHNTYIKEFVKVNYEGAAGSQDFLENGDVFGNIWVGEIKDGKFTGSAFGEEDSCWTPSFTNEP